jgi:hypothetical protein
MDGGGARSAPFGVLMSPKRRVRAKTHLVTIRMLFAPEAKNETNT